MLWYYGFILCIKWETLGLWFNVNCFRFLEQKWLNCSYGRMIGNAFNPLPLPSSIPVPMCFCGNTCKVAKFDEEDTYRQRYWMCSNFAFEPPLRQLRINKMVGNWCCVIIILCHMTSCIIFLFCNNCICCRLLHRSVILSSGSTLRSSLKTRNGCKNYCGERQRTRRWWRRDAEMRL